MHVTEPVPPEENPSQKKRSLMFSFIFLVILIILGGLIWYYPWRAALVPQVSIMFDHGSKLVYTTNTALPPEPYRNHCDYIGGEFHVCGTMCEDTVQACPEICAYTCELFNREDFTGAIINDNLDNQARVYLVRTNGEGDIGEVIDCNDSLEPMILAMETNDHDVVSETLNLLFNMEIKNASETSLYNALYESPLEVESVIFSDGKATVNLTGDLVFDSKCDQYRAQAQINKTLLQFPFIQTTDIFLNAEPLDELLFSESPETGVDLSEAEVLPSGTFKSREDSLPFGTVYVRGYPEIETRPEPFCETDCAEHHYVWFHIVQKSQNSAFDQFLENQKGNAYIEENQIGIGCQVNDRIEYVNDFFNGSKTERKEFILAPETAENIFNATAEEPVTLKLDKKLLVLGSGAPACYSHFTDIEVGE